MEGDFTTAFRSQSFSLIAAIFQLRRVQPPASRPKVADTNSVWPPAGSEIGGTTSETQDSPRPRGESLDDALKELDLLDQRQLVAGPLAAHVGKNFLEMTFMTDLR